MGSPQVPTFHAFTVDAAWICLLGLGATACIEYKFTPIEDEPAGDGGTDGDGGADDDPILDSSGVACREAGGVAYPLNDPVEANYGNNGCPSVELGCVFRGVDASGAPLLFSGRNLLNTYEAGAVGYSSSDLGGRGELPSEDIPVHFGMIEEGTTQAEWTADSSKVHVGIDLYPSVDPDLYGVTGNWMVTVRRADGRLGSGVDELDEICDERWWPFVAIRDPDAASSTGGIVGDAPECVERYADVFVCLVFEDAECSESSGLAADGYEPIDIDPPATADASPASDARTSCQPGSGRFRLVSTGRPTNPADLRLRPIQIDGTGILTHDARVLTISVPADGLIGVAGDLPVPSGLKEPSGAGADPQRWLSAKSNLVDRSVHGDLRFVVSTQALGLRASSLDVEMAWSCPAGPPDLPVASRVSFTLAQVGCPVDWPQKFFLELAPIGSPPLGRDDLTSRDTRRFVEVGTPASGTGRRIELVPAANGPGFDFDFREQGLSIEGTLVRADSNGVLLQSRDASWRGLPICMPGTFYLPTGDRTDVQP